LNKRNNFGAQLFPKLPLAFFPQKWEEVFSLGQSVDGLCSFFYQATIFSFSSISLSFFFAVHSFRGNNVVKSGSKKFTSPIFVSMETKK
jgi:hypothetical protein